MSIRLDMICVRKHIIMMYKVTVSTHLILTSGKQDERDDVKIHKRSFKLEFWRRRRILSFHVLLIIKKYLTQQAYGILHIIYVVLSGRP